MEPESGDSVLRQSCEPIASGTANQEAEAEQEAILKEEEQSTDAFARAARAQLPPESDCSKDFAALVERGRQLAIAVAELLATSRELRAAARLARQEAMRTLDRSTSTRHHSEVVPLAHSPAPVPAWSWTAALRRQEIELTKLPRGKQR